MLEEWAERAVMVDWGKKREKKNSGARQFWVVFTGHWQKYKKILKLIFDKPFYRKPAVTQFLKNIINYSFKIYQIKTNFLKK